MAITVNAHITGTVWKINVKVGDAVAEGDTVAILESMKMEIPVESPVGGTVAEVNVAPKAQVQDGDLIAVMQARLGRRVLPVDGEAGSPTQVS